MKNFQVKMLKDINPQLCQQLKRFCYEVNGCCQMVHHEMGPFLNEYMYQDALEIILNEREIKHQKEFYFSVMFHGKTIRHKHYVDFFVSDKIFVECKAVEHLMAEHRQQLWNYMRLSKTPIGILYNFAPIHDQSEHYYLDPQTNILYLF